MKNLFPFIKKYKKESILAPLFKMLEAMMDLIVPLVIAEIIDTGIATGDNSFILSRFLFLILLAVAGLSFSITAQWFAARASVGFATDLRQSLFDHISSLSYSRLDTIGTDTLITRMTSDVNTLQNGVNMSLRLLLRSPFIVFGAMICAFFIDWKSALVFVVAIPLLSLVIYGLMMLSIPLYKKVQTKLDQVLKLLRENLTGVRVIRAFCHEEEEVEKFDLENKELTHLNLIVGRISALMNPLTYVLINIATVVLIEVGGIRVNSGAIQQGDVVAMYNYMAQMIVELIKLANMIVTLNKAVACGERVSQVLSIEPGMEYPEEGCNKKESKTATTKVPTVHFQDVSFRYEGGGEDALSHITFDAYQGETIGIIGGTGSGKSTLVNLIPRFYDVTSGEVCIDGMDARDYEKGELVSKIGVVPQKAVLFEGTIRENLKFGQDDLTDEELWQALEIAQGKEVVLGKEKQLDSYVEQGGRNLSGGQKQRLTIARALSRKPEILILDDSSSALDYATDAALRKGLRSLGGEMTTFIVSQRTASLRNADRIIVLDDGKIVGIGTHEELLQTCEVYHEIHVSQFPEQEVVA